MANAHKWLYTPKGSAFLYVKEEYQPLIYPVVISEEGTGATHFQMEFSWTGTMDFAPFLSIPDALAFRAELGEEALMNYMHQLAVSGGNVLAQTWHTETLVSDDMIGAMVDVRLPLADVTTFDAAIFSKTLLVRSDNFRFSPVYPY